MDALFKAHLEMSLAALKQEVDAWTNIAAEIGTEGKPDIVSGVLAMMQLLTRDLESLDTKLTHARQQLFECSAAAELDSCLHVATKAVVLDEL